MWRLLSKICHGKSDYMSWQLISNNGAGISAGGICGSPVLLSANWARLFIVLASRVTATKAILSMLYLCLIILLIILSLHHKDKSFRCFRGARTIRDLRARRSICILVARTTYHVCSRSRFFNSFLLSQIFIYRKQVGNLACSPYGSPVSIRFYMFYDYVYARSN